MILSDAYKIIKPSIVAICTKITRNPYFPDIIGTGFIVGEDGLIMTNQHIIDIISKLPRLRDASPDEWPIFCMLFYFIPGKGMAQIPLEVKGVMGIASYSPGGYSYGDKPDVGFIRVNTTGLPMVNIAEKFELEEGEELGISGFPMGTQTLQAPGWIHQISPTLKIGHLAATLPFPCENPHAILLDSAMQGGNSGSPVFSNKGEVVGLLYGGIEEDFNMKNPAEETKILQYKVPTNLSLAVPNQLLHFALKAARESKFYNEHKFESHTLEDFMTKNKGVVLEPKSPLKTLIPIPEDEVQKFTTKEVLKSTRK